MTFGLRTPKIVLPEPMVRTAPSAEIRYCVAHEWSHIRNRDIVVWWAVQLLQPLVWFQPLYWYLRRELRLRRIRSPIILLPHELLTRLRMPKSYWIWRSSTAAFSRALR